MKSLKILFLSMLLFSFPLIAAELPEQPAALDIPQMIQKIEKRRGVWIALKAEVGMEFFTGGNYRASCSGNLFYQKLDEKILLQCVNDQKELVFIFKTDDRLFELYLPGRKSVFRGNIFDLEDSPEIQSHLRAQDLYRALKPLAIPEEAQITSENPEKVSLRLDRKHQGYVLPARDILVTQEGDVAEEKYYDLEGEPHAMIRRSEFKNIPDPLKKRKNPFPHKIEIVSFQAGAKEKTSETRIVFEKVEFIPEMEDSVFEVPVADGTRQITLADSSSS